MPTDQQASLASRLVSRLRWVHLAPLLAFVTLGAWAFASPVGAGPDDDFHLVSVYCAAGGSEGCEPSDDTNQRFVSEAFQTVVCYTRDQAQSAECLDEEGLALDGATYETYRGNFARQYPAVHYWVMSAFAGSDLEQSAVVMRLVNAALFVALVTALAVCVPWRRPTLLWGFLVTLLPLGLFVIASNNPSSWVITGVGTAFVATLGWFEGDGWRRWVSGAVLAIALLMAGGARADGAVYAAGAAAVAALLTFAWSRRWLVRASLPAAGVVLEVILFTTSRQGELASQGFSGGSSSGPLVGESVAQPTSQTALAAYNLLMLPDLWTGTWGTWGLGWLDTPMPAVVPWGGVAVFVIVAFAGLGLLNWRKAIAAAGVFVVLVATPVYVLTTGGDVVGEQVQPRYFLPVIVLFALVLVAAPVGGRGVGLTRFQTALVLGTLGVAHLVALQANIRRYVTGTDEQGFNLDAGAEWWWDGLPFGPTALWFIGSAAFVGLLVVLWPQLRARDTAPEAVETQLSR